VKKHTLAVHPDTWKSFHDFVNDAKTKGVTIALVGGSAHFQGYLMEAALGMKVKWVPYESSGEAMAAVAGKHADAVLTFSISPRPLVRAGKLRPIAVFSLTPDPILPGAPNFKEMKLEEVPLVLIYGVLMAPPNTPREVTAIVEKAVENAISNPAFKDVAEKAGIGVEFRSSSELQKQVSEDYEISNKYKQFLK